MENCLSCRKACNILNKLNLLLFGIIVSGQNAEIRTFISDGANKSYRLSTKNPKLYFCSLGKFINVILAVFCIFWFK